MRCQDASQGIMLAQLMTTVPILEVFVHEVEAAGDDARLLRTANWLVNKFG